MENEMMRQVLLFASVISPFVAGLLQMVKRVAKIPKNYLPLISVAIGVGLGAIAYPFTEMELILRLWAGAGAGLASTGLFELVKTRPGHTRKLNED